MSMQPVNNEVVIDSCGLTKSFNGRAVLKDITLQLYRQENLVVLGRSGSGKSVLIKIIAGLLPADGGTVTVLGEEVERLSKKALDRLRLRLGFCFQNSALYDSMTVEENLAFPLYYHYRQLPEEEKQEKIAAALQAVGLYELKKMYPAALSGGQKKRAGIARTLILQPEIMLYDEPTSGLDPITSGEINELINQVQQQYRTSAIIITHDLTCARDTGNRLMMLEDGVIKHTGTFDALFAHADAQAQMFYNYNFIK